MPVREASRRIDPHGQAPAFPRTRQGASRRHFVHCARRVHFSGRPADLVAPSGPRGLPGPNQLDVPGHRHVCAGRPGSPGAPLVAPTRTGCRIGRHPAVARAPASPAGDVRPLHVKSKSHAAVQGCGQSRHHALDDQILPRQRQREPVTESNLGAQRCPCIAENAHTDGDQNHCAAVPHLISRVPGTGATIVPDGTRATHAPHAPHAPSRTDRQTGPHDKHGRRRAHGRTETRARRQRRRLLKPPDARHPGKQHQPHDVTAS